MSIIRAGYLARPIGKSMPLTWTTSGLKEKICSLGRPKDRGFQLYIILAGLGPSIWMSQLHAGLDGQIKDVDTGL